MSTTMTEAIRKTVLVDFPPEQAFDLFTRRIAKWWPVQSHSYGGDDVTDVVFEFEIGGRVYEVTNEGEQDWGRVRELDPPNRFLLEWLIGEASGTEVEVTGRARGPRLARRPRASRLRVARPAGGTTTRAGVWCSAAFAASESRKA